MIHYRYRRLVPTALAVFSLGLIGFAGTASAAAVNNASDSGASHSAQAPGQEKKAGPAADGGTADTAAAPADAPADASSKSSSDQVCNGDPTGASSTGSGANSGNGDYTNTCDAGPSLNGNNDDKVNGKPCAGCVGNADDKNPPGQYQNGNDANNGYECDQKGGGANQGNNGVGFGNPAHTGCSQSIAPPPECNPATDANQCKPCPGGKDMPASGSCDEQKPPTCPDGLSMPANGVCDQTPVVPHETVQATSVEIPAQVLGEELVRPAVEAATVAAAGTSLPRTGIDVLALVRIALLLAAGGFGLVLAARLRRRHATIDIASRLG